MRILVATDQWFPDVLGGVARVAAGTSRGWAAAGHDVVVLAPREDGNNVPEGRPVEGEPTVVRALPRGLLPQTLVDPLWTRRSAVRVGTKGFDVLVAHTCTTAWGLLRAHPRLPLLDVFHADAAEESRYMRSTAPTRRARLSASLLEHPLRRLERRTLRDADAVVVLSEFSRRLLTNLAPDAAATALRVPAGIDTNVFTPDGRDKSRALLGVGPSTRLLFTVRRLVPRMGLEHLVDAAASLSDLGDVRVAIAGEGPLASDLEVRRRRLGLEGRVELLGRVPDEELPSWYRAADLVVVPSLAHEGFGLVTAEALASGTPVVGSPVGATPELLEPIEPRLVATGTSAAALGDAIRNGLGLATRDLRARCREYALANLSWTVVLPAWEHALEVAAWRRQDRDRLSA
jgi:glycosyltransferase involved in cell wall biosynthesis